MSPHAAHVRFPLLCILACAVPASADSITINAGGKEAVVRDVRITQIDSGRLAFIENATGRQSLRELSEVTRVALDDEPRLAQAESAYIERRWPDAVAGYRDIVETTRRDWLRAWCAPRLVESAQNAHDLGAAVTGFVALIKTNPARAETIFVTISNNTDPSILARAVQAVTEAASDPKLVPRQRGALNALLLDLHRARKDTAAADALLEQMLKSGDDSAARAIVRKKLDQTASLLESGQFQQAIDSINHNRQVFVEQRDQAEALYYLAEASLGLVPRGVEETEKLKDAALAYMRVVAHFQDAPGAPFVAPALLKTAGIEERLGDLPAARKLYQQAATTFDRTPAAASARQSLQRLEPEK